MSKKRISIIVVIIVAVLLLAPLVVPKFVPWSGINCRHQEINIKTGQARYSRILWFIKISERVEDTPLSLVLQGETEDVANITPWHRVNTSSPGIHHSPHYMFHSAFGQAKDLELVLDMHNASELQRKDAAVGLLAIWQTSGNDSKAGTYLNELQRQLEQGDPADSSIASRSQSG
jgi:hypothetical protein